MIELILDLLIDIGLINADYKHRKQLRKKEKEDGVPRPFRKRFLQPSVLVTVCSAITAIVLVASFFMYQHFKVYPQKTEKEIVAISDKIQGWKQKYGHYPKDLSQLIGNNPIRQEWKNDIWNRTYKYKVIHNGTAFLLQSAGADGKFDTQDDITNK